MDDSSRRRRSDDVVVPIVDPSESFGGSRNSKSVHERELIDAIKTGSLNQLNHLIDIVDIDPFAIRMPTTVPRRFILPCLTRT